VAGELGAEVARNLAPGGTMLVYGALSSHRQTDPAKFIMPLFAPRLIYSTATVRGWWLPRWVPSQPLAEVRAATSDLLAMLSKEALRRQRLCGIHLRTSKRQYAWPTVRRDRKRSCWTSPNDHS
jgi:hypothetical protein